MPDEGHRGSALGDLRVVDLTDDTGVYAAKLFADLGADVIRVERPSGDPMRRQAPLFEGPSGATRSLPFLHFNTNKRSLALDYEATAGREVLDRLLPSADVLIESFHPAEAERLGLTNEHVAGVAPRLIHASVTGFGIGGPHGDYRWSDLVAQAMAGLLMLTGFPEDPPVRLPAAQAYHQASLEAAVGVMALVFRRDDDGRGGHVEVSMQDALAISTLQTANLNHWTQLHVVPIRTGSGNPARDFSSGSTHGKSVRRTVYRCRDGWLVTGLRMVDWDQTVAWLSEFGDAGGLDDPRFEDPAARSLAEMYPVIERVLEEHAVDELYHSGQRHGLLTMPVRGVEELFEDEQLSARGFLVELEHPELGTTLTYAGAPYQLSETPWRLRRRAPEVGEHSAAILEGLGYTEAEVGELGALGVVATEQVEVEASR